jgi:hypothetical protein
MPPPTVEPVTKLEGGVGTKNLKRKGVDQRRQEAKERKEEWPQVVVKEIKQLASIKGPSNHPANHSAARLEEVLVESSKRGSS